MSDRAKAIIKDVLDNHLPRIVEGLQKGYPDENQILVAYDHAVRARILAEQPEPLDEADYISNKQDEAWLDAIAKQWNTLTGKAWETKDDIEANVTALFEQLTASQARVKKLEETTVAAHENRLRIASERIATLEQALREAATWAQAEQAVNDCPEYSEKAQGDLRSKLKMPVGFRTLGDYLDELRQKALATISTALKDEKEGK